MSAAIYPGTRRGWEAGDPWGGHAAGQASTTSRRPAGTVGYELMWPGPGVPVGWGWDDPTRENLPRVVVDEASRDPGRARPGEGGKTEQVRARSTCARRRRVVVPRRSRCGCPLNDRRSARTASSHQGAAESRQEQNGRAIERLQALAKEAEVRSRARPTSLLTHQEAEPRGRGVRSQVKDGAKMSPEIVDVSGRGA